MLLLRMSYLFARQLPHSKIQYIAAGRRIPYPYIKHPTAHLRGHGRRRASWPNFGARSAHGYIIINGKSETIIGPGSAKQIATTVKKPSLVINYFWNPGNSKNR